MNGWRVSAALSRALSLAGIGLASAVLFGEPALMVITAPYLVFGAFGLLHRPTLVPRLDSRPDHGVLHEGQGTRSRLTVDDPSELESVTRVVAGVPHVAVRPLGGMVAARIDQDEREISVLEVSPRRWGRRVLGEENVLLTSGWAGFELGPVDLAGGQLEVLPVRAPFDSRAEAPQPIGLVGAHRSRRLGDGSEFAAIRPFHAGDRLRRINWRVSLRTGDLHVVTSRGEEDAGILLLLDALADHGISRGVDGPPSSLDVTVRAAAALAEHHVRTGDRIGLRVVGGTDASLAPAAGRGHLRRLQSRLAQLRAAHPHVLSAERFQLGVAPGTVVLVLSPMLTDVMGTITGMLVRRGLPVLVIDTLPGELAPSVVEGTDPAIADLAWRMRLLEREQVLARLSAMGCPVVPWSGPGTLDDVMRRLARRSQLPQVRVR